MANTHGPTRWYPIRAGMLGYWDGQRWTGQEAPMPPTPAPITGVNLWGGLPKQARNLIVIGVLVLAAIVVVGISVANSNDDEGDPDASAELACGHFRNVAGDIAAGVLTDAEVREKLQEVDRSASVSEEAGIASGARAMLAAVTRGDLAALTEAVGDFGDACRDLGL